jgi:hypothetical protein
MCQFGSLRLRLRRLGANSIKKVSGLAMACVLFDYRGDRGHSLNGVGESRLRSLRYFTLGFAKYAGLPTVSRYLGA